ncbi:HugZ family protein [Aestuariirhabdus sp. LZHN29]|uniref:HugZ family pyridoxamine 5'-phosphate oxidase n=1 Tax=Aestuariirhabdus sp. LZHN29 TaxID=3417462 RepID=UPI003CED6890
MEPRTNSLTQVKDAPATGGEIPGQQLEHFLAARNSLMLATTDARGTPLASYAPCYIEQGSIFVFLSELAPHTDNLLQDNELSVLLIEDEAQCSNPFRRQRLSCQGTVIRVERDSDRWLQKTAQLEKRLGKTMGLLKQLGDFHLFQITPTRGTFVCGFGKAYRIQGLDGASLVAIEGR